MADPVIESYAVQIERLLAEPLASAAQRERETFRHELSRTDGTVVVFGAGRLGRLCARALQRGGVPLRAFCDGNAQRQGVIQDGVAIIAPVEAARRFPQALFVVAIWTGTARETMVERLAYLQQLGCAHVTSYAPLVWAHGAEEAPFHSFDLPTRTLAAAAPLRELAARLADDASRRVLWVALRQRLLGIFDATAPAAEQYFPGDIVRLTEDEVFVDGGAFDGDTLADFVGRVGERFAHYHAFEPDAANRARLMGRVQGLPAAVRAKITIHPIALHAESSTLSFTDQGGPTSHLGTGGNISVRGERLDAILAAQRLSFLKLDVEGAERASLAGAKASLTQHRPQVAACVYHEPSDLWEIPQLLAALLPNSRFYLRPHGFDGWETVVYVVPQK
ncbi:MAG: FkbM family methyltransferase [Opitutaceae bacterium]